jgi:hypothetical protein
MDMEKKENFLGTYFSKEVILRITAFAKSLSWVIVGIYALQWLFQIITFFLQVARGYWVGMGFTDYANSILSLCEMPLRGVVYFVVLQAVAQVLLMFMDIEDNTRRAAREEEKK